jgi:DNA repair protein RadC
MTEQRFLFDRGGALTLVPDEGHAEDPITRLFDHGSETLSDCELVAIVTGQPLSEARKLVADGLPVFARHAWNVGAHDRVRRLIAARIAACLELGRRVATIPADPEVPLKVAEVGRRLGTKYGDEVQEHFGAIFLTSRGTVIAERVLSVGTLTSALVSPRDVLRYALVLHAAQIIVFHNHPSGSPTPSDEDHAMTRKLKEAAATMDVTLLDHIIVSRHRYYSMYDHGEM